MIKLLYGHGLQKVLEIKPSWKLSLILLPLFNTFTIYNRNPVHKLDAVYLLCNFAQEEICFRGSADYV
jgi:hypothetical protein